MFPILKDKPGVALSSRTLPWDHADIYSVKLGRELTSSLKFRLESMDIHVRAARGWGVGDANLQSFYIWDFSTNDVFIKR